MSSRSQRCLLLGLALLPALAGCAAEQVHSRWSASPLAINGQADDWAVASLVELEDQRLSLAAQNDADHLHLLLQVRDGRLARVLRGRGFQLWFCPDASRCQDTGILVPAVPAPSRPARDLAAATAPDAVDRPPPVRTTIPERITALAEARGSRLLKNRAGEASGTALALMAYPGGLALELRLPLEAAADEEWRVAPGKGGRIYVGIEYVGPLNKPEIARSGYGDEPGGRGGGMGGRGGGMSRGGRGGPGRAGGPGPRGPGAMTLKAKEIWMRILLAEPDR